MWRCVRRHSLMLPFVLTTSFTISGCGGRSDLSVSRADASASWDAGCRPIGQDLLTKDGSTECLENLECRDETFQYHVECSCPSNTCTCSRLIPYDKPELLKTINVSYCP